MTKDSGLRRNPLLDKSRRKERISTYQHTDKPTYQQVDKSPYTKRATFYFSPDQLRELEEVRFNLLQEYNIKTNKSAIVRTALDETIKDFREKKQNSRLYKGFLVKIKRDHSPFLGNEHGRRVWGGRQEKIFDSSFSIGRKVSRRLLNKTPMGD